MYISTIGLLETGSEPQTLKLGRKKMHRYLNWWRQRAFARTLAHQAVAEIESSDASAP